MFLKKIRTKGWVHGSKYKIPPSKLTAFSIGKNKKTNTTTRTTT
jgi:hypothetical protein